MSTIHTCTLPDGALLERYSDSGYVDCYTTQIASVISHERYVSTFYTTPVFKLERLILAWAAGKPSTDQQATQLAAGTRDTFAAWSVEARAGNQLLLCDYQGRTRSWLMNEASGEGTTLYFGSAVVANRDSRSSKHPMGPAFRALLGFHKLYSVVLLRAARSRLLSPPA